MALFTAFVWGITLILAAYSAYSVITADVENVDLPDTDDATSKKGGTALSNSKSTAEIIKPIYGLAARVGINKVFEETAGADLQTMHVVGIIGEGPIQGIEKIDGVSQLFFDGEIYTKWEGYVSFEIFNGTADQDVCSTLNTAFPKWTDPLRYTAYIYIAITYNKDKFLKTPSITLRVRGLKSYDPDLRLSYFTSNPAVIAHDVMTKSSARGGMGMPPEDKIPAPQRFNSDLVDVSSFTTTKDYCTTSGWVFNSPIIDNSPVSDTITMICNHYRGAIIYSEGLFKFRYRDSSELSSPVMSLDETNIVAIADRTQFSLTPVADVYQRPNAMKVNFTNIAKNLQQDNYIFEDVEAIATEGDYREKELNLYGFNTIDLISKMAAYGLERSRWGTDVSLVANSEAMKLDLLDVVDVTYSHIGWNSVLARVIRMSINTDATVNLTLREERAELYDDTYNPPPSLEWFTSDLIGPNDPIPSVINLVLDEETVTIRGRTVTKLIVTFDAPPVTTYPFWSYALAWYAISNTTPEQSAYRFFGKVDGDFIIDNVKEEDRYHIRLQSVNIFGQVEPWDNSAYSTRAILGKEDLPSDLKGLYAQVNGDSVTLYADPVSDPDIDGYETRLGSNWSGAIFISYNKSPTVKLVGVKPGIHTFWMSPKDTSRRYSENAAGCTVRVYLANGFTLANTLPSALTTFDFSNPNTNFFGNSQLYTDGVSNYLRVYGFSEQVVDGGFENGFTDWDASNSSTLDTTNPNGGSNCAKLTATGSGISGANQDIEVNGLNRYSISVWADLDSYTSGNFYPCIFHYLDHDKNFLGQDNTGSLTATTSGYIEHSGIIGSHLDTDADYQMHEGTYYIRIFAGYTDSGVGVLYIDDVSLKPVWNQLVNDGTCQRVGYDPGLSNLYALIVYGGSHAITLDEPDVGSYSLKYTGNGVSTQNFMEVYCGNYYSFQGLDYSISVRVFNPSGNTDITTLSLYSETEDREGNVSYTFLDSTTVKDEWTELSGETNNVNEYNLTGFFIFANGSPTTEVFYSRDYSCRIIGPVNSDYEAEIYPFVGFWATSQVDLGAIKVVRVYAPFEFTFSGSGSTFGGIFGTSGTFGDFGAEVKSFGQLSVPSEAGRFRARLLYKENLGDDYSYLDYFEILSGEIKARYLSMQILTTNPNENSSLIIKEFQVFAYTGPTEV